MAGVSPSGSGARQAVARSAEPARVLDRGDRARAAVGAGTAARGHQDHLRARRRGRQDQLARAGGRSTLGVALAFRHQAEPAGRRDLHDRRATILDQPEAGVDLAAERVMHAGPRGLAAERGQHDGRREHHAEQPVVRDGDGVVGHPPADDEGERQQAVAERRVEGGQERC